MSPTGATISGEDIVVNQNYKVMARLGGQDGWVFSPHEFVIAGGHFAWVTAYNSRSTERGPSERAPPAIAAQR